MNKAALLIGVSDYSDESGLKPLPNAAQDVEAMQRVLLRSSEFSADQIRVLTNPQKQEVEEAIYWLFANRQKEDLLLFYFSGHGIKDDTGKLYFSLPGTKKEQQGKLMRHTAVSATVLHEHMNDSRSTCQVLVLDCCFSAAFAKGLTIKDDGSVNIPDQLGGKGRAIFTSSNSVEYSFEQEGLLLSVYTHFFVEGLETGVADLDGDGLISADELHTYVSDKVKTTAPAMTPQFFPVQQGHKIYLARSIRDDPKLNYRKAVEQRIGSFQIVKNRFSIPARAALDLLSRQLGIAADVAETIEAEVLQPLREYQRKLRDYERMLNDTLEDEGYPFSEAVRNDLKDCQALLGLPDEDVQQIEANLLPAILPPQLTPSTPATLPFEVITVDAQEQEVDRRPEREQKRVGENKEIVEDNQREEALQAYFDRLSTLLIDKNLIAVAARVSKADASGQGQDQTIEEQRGQLDAAVNMIRAITLSILRQFSKDGEGKGSIIRFLIDSEVINKLNLSLEGADLSNADLSYANLNNANFRNADFSYADLHRATLNHANLMGTKLKETNFRETSLSGANLLKADFRDTILSNTDLSDAQLYQANFSAANLSGVGFNRANLGSANLENANLKHAYLDDVRLEHANLKNANLYGARLQRAYFINAHLNAADLTGVNFSSANCCNADFTDAKLRDAYLVDADLSEARGWTEEQLSAAKLCRTKLPAGCKLDPNRDCEKLMGSTSQIQSG